MQNLKKTTVQPTKFSNPQEPQVKNNRKKNNPRNKSKAFKIDKELEEMLFDLMEEYGIKTESEMIFQLLNTHPLLVKKRNKEFFINEENKVNLENFINFSDFFISILKHSTRKALKEKRSTNL